MVQGVKDYTPINGDHQWIFSTAEGNEVRLRDWTIGQSNVIAAHAETGTSLPDAQLFAHDVWPRSGVRLDVARHASREFTLLVDFFGEDASHVAHNMNYVKAAMSIVKDGRTPRLGKLTHKYIHFEKERTKQIMCGLSSGASGHPAQRIGAFTWRVPLTFVAPYPYFFGRENLAAVPIKSEFVNWQTGFVPGGDPKTIWNLWRAGDHSAQIAVPISYRGEVSSRSMTIEIPGPMNKGIRISNTATGRFLFYNRAINAGSRLLIKMGYRPLDTPNLLANTGISAGSGNFNAKIINDNGTSASAFRYFSDKSTPIPLEAYRESTGEVHGIGNLISFLWSGAPDYLRIRWFNEYVGGW